MPARKPSRRAGGDDLVRQTDRTDQRHVPEERQPDAGIYDVAPITMPPSPAGAEAERWGEAAASRRLAGLPPDVARRPEHRPGEPTPDPEPFLGYDGLDTDGVLAWIRDADPEPELLRAIRAYESTHRRRPAILEECTDRLRRLVGGEGAP